MEIKEGLYQGSDVSIYAKKEFTHEQMKQIKEGLLRKLDVSIYAKTFYKQKQMMIIKEALNKKLNVDILKDPKLNLKELKAFLTLLELGWNIASSENEDKTITVNKEKSIL